MNHDEDDDLYFVDPCGWRVAIVALIAAVVVGIVAVGVKTLIAGDV
jgi:hypothetical protein